MMFPSSGFLFFAALLSSESVNARPITSRRDDGVIHLPLKRLHNLERTDIRPHVLYQQHVNRGLRRIARMTRRAEPSEEQLRSNIAKRMFIPTSNLPSTQEDSSSSSNNKRLFIPRGGLPSHTATSSTSKKRVYTPANLPLFKRPLRQHARDLLSHLVGRVDAVLGVNDAVNGGGKHRHGGGGTGDDSTNPTGGTCTTGTTGGNTSTPTGTGAGTPAGFSQINLEAAQEDTVTNSVITTNNGTTGLDIEANDVAYFATVQIGTPPRDFKVIMDSGSSDFWVQATQCTIQGSTQACSAKHRTLGTSTSSSFVDTQKPFKVTYGSGAVSGTIVTDDVTLAGLSLPQHTFGVADVETTDFGANTVATDGLMGLAKSELSNQGVLTPVESLAKAGAINAAITTFKISRLADQQNDGQVTIGGLDQSLFNPATLVTIPNVNAQGFWEGAVDAITVNGSNTGLTGRTAILDTGTTLIVAPPADVAAVHAAIPGAKSDGQGGFTVPCTTTASVALTFGGRSFAIDPRDIAFLPATNDLAGDCLSGISSGQIGGATEWLVGDVFLKNALFSTDEGANTISLANFV